MIDKIEFFLDTIDMILDTRRKRHLFGGLLMSMSLLFGGLSVTVITIKEDRKKDEPDNY